MSGYTKGEGDFGIKVFELDMQKRTYRLLSETDGIESPSYCTIADAIGKERLYVASETQTHGGLAHCAVSGSDFPLQDQVRFDGAAGTCYALMHPEGKALYGADYNSGSVSVVSLTEDGGLVGKATLIQHEGHGPKRDKSDLDFGRQDSPHVHTLSMIPGTHLLTACDLGLDLIAVYQTDDSGMPVDALGKPVINEWPLSSTTVKLSEDASDAGYAIQLTRSGADGHGENMARLPIRPAAIVEAPLYSGPRILAYHPTEPIVALICELGCEVIIFKIEDDGLKWTPIHRWNLLEEIPESEIEALGQPPLSAHAEFTSDGCFLYTSTRGTDTLTAFELGDDMAIRSRTTFDCAGNTPRHFALSEDDALVAVANQTSADVTIFERDISTGRLDFAMHIPFETPSCVIWR